MEDEPQLDSSLFFLPEEINGSNDDQVSFIHEYLQSNVKVAVLLQRQIGEVKVEKQSVDVKLLSSVMYEVGKEVARPAEIPNTSHPEGATKGYFPFASNWFEILYLGWRTFLRIAPS